METESRKQSLCILALLAVFAAGLGLAYLLVASKSTIKLTEPIALPGTGISAPLPENSEWEGMERWRYELNNSFVLASRMQSSRFLAAEVQWRFMQTSPEESAADVLETIARSYSASASNPNRISGPVPFEWIHIASNDLPGDIVFAVAVLEKGKVLQLRIHAVSEPSYAEDLLFSLTQKVIYETDPAAEIGNELLESLYSQEISKLFNKNTYLNPPLLLKDAAGKPSGYKISDAEKIDHGREYPLSFRYNEYYKFGNSLSRTESRIEISPEVFEFLWITVESRPKRQIRHELARQKDGSLLVRDMAGRQETFWSSSGSVPEILLPFYIWHFAQSSYERAIADLISSEGLIVPTELTRLDPASSRIKSESVKFVVKADFLHDPQNFEEYYFDAEGNLLGKYENYADLQNRLWEKSTMKQIIFNFGDLFQSPEKVAQKRRFSEQTITLIRQER